MSPTTRASHSVSLWRSSVVGGSLVGPLGRLYQLPPRRALASFAGVTIGLCAMVWFFGDTTLVPVVVLAAMTLSLPVFGAFWSINHEALVATTQSLNSVRALAWQADRSARITQIVGPVELLTGRTAADLLGQDLLALLDESDKAGSLEWISELSTNDSTSLVHQFGVGEKRTFRTTVRLVRHPTDSTKSTLHGVTVDISHDWAKAGERQRRHAAVVQQMSDGLLLLRTNSDGVEIEQLNHQAAAMIGIEIDSSWADLASRHPELGTRLLDTVAARRPDDWRHRVNTDAATWLAVRCFGVTDDTMAVQLSDVSDDVRAEDKIKFEATHDDLTGLLNARAVRECLAERLSVQPSVTVALLDLNGFKAVNDDHGHAAGDQVLAAIAQRLQHTIKSQDSVARLGGDEFIVVFQSNVGTADRAEIRERLSKACGEPVGIHDGSMVQVSAAIGFANHSGAGSGDVDALIAEADAEMYLEKRATRANQPLVRRQAH